MEIKFLFNFKDFLINYGLPESQAITINAILGVFTIILFAYLSDVILKRIIHGTLARIIKKTTTTWDDIILERGVFDRLSHLAPALIIHFSIGYVLASFEKLVPFLQGIVSIYIIVLALLVINSFLHALQEIFQTFDVSKNKSIRGYVQIIQIFIYSIAIILILSILLGQSPYKLLAGLGALAAVLILVFKDTILGFVASIQLSANKMVQIGDWITMPKFNADGIVIEMTLYTVKVQNGDKTISTIPTYSLVSESFTNWRGMQESGGRRIKRFLKIDMKSVKFCTPEMIDKFGKISFLKTYLEVKQKELAKYNKENSFDETVLVNGRRLTNIGVFRKYLEEYLRKNTRLHQEMNLVVRHLQPDENGIPIEIVAFSKEQEWANYEEVQADIFDHILAVLPEFDLRVFQNPTGDDFNKLKLSSN